MRLFIFIILIGFSCCKRPNRGISHEPNNGNNNSTIRQQNLIGSEIEMINENGVYKIPTEINGVTMKFIFDTGASTISISETEALYLYKQGAINEEDILGSVYFQDATGNISEGTEINLRSVKIGRNEVFNVKASVVHNLQAPLLLGQSALSRFGKVTIDYDKSTIRFE
ncbi:MAG: aspartyl protease family protein [Psychroserpens sp.]|jgi:aspartyl protease family protein